MGSDEKRIMAALLALVATILTSFLPILNKHLLRDARPALVAWITNAASLPILAAGTFLVYCGTAAVWGFFSRWPYGYWPH